MPEDQGEEVCRIFITYHGATTETEGDPAEPVLASVLERGIAVPFSCQSGTCLACSALLLEGEVKMKDSPALSQTSKAEGVILTCTAFPRSRKIWVSYDD